MSRAQEAHQQPLPKQIGQHSVSAFASHHLHIPTERELLIYRPGFRQARNRYLMLGRANGRYERKG